MKPSGLVRSKNKEEVSHNVVWLSISSLQQKNELLANQAFRECLTKHLQTAVIFHAI
jgi:hypothetical protein